MKNFGLKKLYYSISEVSKLTGVEQYILRYWETEFGQLRPSKNRAGNRIYTNKDINLILQIKKLLREEKYTIEGAKKILDDKVVYSEPQIEVEEQMPQQKIISNVVTPNQLLLMELKHFLVNLSRQI
jgi:DNA-binding transcriptional MerR regulator